MLPPPRLSFYRPVAAWGVAPFALWGGGSHAHLRLHPTVPSWAVPDDDEGYQHRPSRPGAASAQRSRQMGCSLSSCCGCILFPGTPPLEPAEREALVRHPGFVWLEPGRGGRRPAVFITCPGARLTIMLSHGNAENVAQNVSKCEAMARAHQVNVFIYEYAGYSISTGPKSSEAAMYDDIAAAYRHLTVERRLAPNTIVLFGRSIGSGPTVELASKTAGLAGMVLESGLESACRTQGSLLCCCANTCCCFDNFKNRDSIGKVDCPVLQIHGTADAVIAVANSMNNQRRLQHPVEPFWADGAGHNDVEELHGEEYHRRLKAFFIHCRKNVEDRQWNLVSRARANPSEQRGPPCCHLAPPPCCYSILFFTLPCTAVMSTAGRRGRRGWCKRWGRVRSGRVDAEPYGVTMSRSVVEYSRVCVCDEGVAPPATTLSPSTLRPAA